MVLGLVGAPVIALIVAIIVHLPLLGGLALLWIAILIAGVRHARGTDTD